jgi:NADPH:quinone reductase-like Zn-dependent oxidoreductase
MNAVPFGTSRTADKIQRAKEFGLESGFLVPDTPRPEDGLQWAATGGFDVIADLVGGAYVGADLRALAPHGRILLIGTTAGAKSEIELGLMLGKRAHMMGTVLRARPLEEKITVARNFAREVLPLFSRGVLRAVVDSVYSFRDVRRAQERMESNESFGKIVLRM